MSGYESPWASAKRGRPGPCRYGCGQQAWLVEPASGKVAHQVCADRAAGDEDAEIAPLTDGTENVKRFVPDEPLGCGEPAPGQTSGRVCAELGTKLSCRLCPRSPTYWRDSLTDEQRARLPGYSGPPPSGLRD